MFCLEVLEHVNEHPLQFLAAVRPLLLFCCRVPASDLRLLCCSQINRVLKKGAKVILTTPNSASFSAIHRIMHHQQAYSYGPFRRRGSTFGPEHIKVCSFCCMHASVCILIRCCR